MSWLLAFPLLIPFITAVPCYFYAERPEMSARISLMGSLAALVAALLLFLRVSEDGVVAGQMGGWAAPFGITLVADMLSAILVVVTALIGVAVAFYAQGEIEFEQSQIGYHAIFQALLGGVTGAFLTGDIFNLYVWFEVMLIASFGLLIIGGRAEQIDGAVKYVALNLVSTILFLSGIGLLYGVTGTLNMADLNAAVANSEKQGLLSVIAIFFIFAFAMKAAVFPLYSWLPAAYHTPAFAVSAVFAALLTKVGIYSLLRVFTLVFDLEGSFGQDLLLWAAVLTMLAGVAGALAATDIRKVLSYQVIASIGSLVLGLAIYSPLAIAGAIFYLIHNMMVKGVLFMSAGVMTRLTGGSDLRRIGGLYASTPVFALIFLVAGFTLAGFPPLTGFWAKLMLVQASLDANAILPAAVILFVGLLTIWSICKIWLDGFLTAHPEGEAETLPQLGNTLIPLMVPIVGLVALLVLMGLMPNYFIGLAQTASDQLLNPELYIDTVLGVSE
ncbi:MAG: proton-conducting transporter membrane subunit [Pseudomonadota bacterium]